MTTVVVIDASCMIDLQKGNLLPELCDLPYGLVIPLPVRASELLNVTNAEWQRLDDGGLITHDLNPAEVEQAFALKYDEAYITN